MYAEASLFCLLLLSSLFPVLSFPLCPLTLFLCLSLSVVTLRSTRASDAGVVTSVVLQVVMCVSLCYTSLDGRRCARGSWRPYSHFTVLV